MSGKKKAQQLADAYAELWDDGEEADDPSIAGDDRLAELWDDGPEPAATPQVQPMGEPIQATAVPSFVGYTPEQLDPYDAYMKSMQRESADAGRYLREKIPQWADSAMNGASEFAQDAARGFERGSQLGQPLDMSGAWNAAASNTMTQGMVPPPKVAQPIAPPEQVQAEWAQADARSPVASFAGDVAGSIANPVSRLSPMASGAIDAGARSFGAGNDPSQVMTDAAQGGAFGKVLDKGGQMLGGAMDWAKNTLAPEMRSKANINRVASTGLYGADMAAMEANKGEQFIQDLGEDIERYGLHKGEGAFGFLPQSAETYGRNAAKLRAEGGQQMGAAEDAINAQVEPPMIDYSPAANDMMDAADDVRNISHPDAPAEAAAREGFANQLYSNGADRTFEQALADRRYYDQQINWQGRGGYKGAGLDEQMTREAAGNVRGSIRQGLDDSVDAGNTAPELRDDWVAGKDKYAVGAAVADPAIARKYREYGNQPLSLGALAASSGDLATAAVAQGVKYRGRPALAGFQRNVQHGAEAFGDSAALENLSGGMQGPAAGAMSGMAAADDRRPYDVVHDSMQTSRGHELESNVEQILYADPALLGRYRGDFEYAGRNPGGIGALLRRLEDQDATFRATVLPMIRGGQ